MIKISNKPRHLRYLGFSEFNIDYEIWPDILKVMDGIDNDFYSNCGKELFIRNPKLELFLKLKFGDKIQEVKHFGSSGYSKHSYYRTL